MNIYLTGYMASGKTYLGQRLAERLEISFFDLDACIEERYGAISTIFAEKGEKAFRNLESETLKTIPSTADAIISCGGGAFCIEKNRQWIQNNGISIYLEVSPEVLYQRLSTNPSQRPIIMANNGSPDELLTFIENHLNSRKEDYEKADIVYSANGDIENMVSELATYFFHFLNML